MAKCSPLLMATVELENDPVPRATHLEQAAYDADAKPENDEAGPKNCGFRQSASFHVPMLS
jgi:hypothetical protein